MLIYWIWLATRSDIGDRMRVALVERFTSPENLYFAEEKELREVPGLQEAGRKSLADKDLEPCKSLLEQCRKLGAGILTLGDPAYPKRLRSISDPPVVLYYQGRLPDFDNEPVIAIVGTRRPSDYGRKAARILGGQVAQCGGLVVSGMAAGLDEAAMVSAMTKDGFVVGVLGCGIDVVYPPFGQPLYDSVRLRGCLMTEFPPGTPPKGSNFPRRNRIISGLSCGVLVVEAPQRSGALITARLAQEQGREVFVLPANIDAAGGSNGLLSHGALPVASGWDILQLYQGSYPDKVIRPRRLQSLPTQENPPVILPAPPPPAPKARTKKPSKPPERKKGIDNGGICAYSDSEKILTGLDEPQARLVSALKNGPRPLEDLIDAMDMASGSVLSMVTMLELRGVIRRLPGRMVELTGK